MQKIESYWDKIDVYYPNALCQWYDDAVKEIVTIPLIFRQNNIPSQHGKILLNNSSLFCFM